jgi:hypothetical protein
MVRLLREFVYFVVALIELLLTFRFVLKLLGASPQADFVAWVYETTQPLLQPFVMAFPTPTVRGGFVLEFTTLFAIFAYAFIGYLIQELLIIIAGRTRTI